MDLVESLIIPWKPNLLLSFFPYHVLEAWDANLKHKFSLIHISMNQITKLDFNAFLWESESGHISLLYHFRGDSTLVSWIANVRDWSKQKNSRFRQRLRVSKRWNHNDFHKFSWSPADFLFSTLKSQFYSCQQPENLANIYFH